MHWFRIQNITGWTALLYLHVTVHEILISNTCAAPPHRKFTVCLPKKKRVRFKQQGIMALFALSIHVEKQLKGRFVATIAHMSHYLQQPPLLEAKQ